ncbi:mannosyltransferase [Lentinula edodes]|uniref:mannosyltransferase n=1 Tax=Lentinula edodes TaxID=5353 RepID=UPI001E8DE461|nr:mannosyltransferase [Lentinula edodes]KAH7874708.1 mannosyltransferase [Lentinula edodes]KAJ3909185.1 mannosyltransferase [Lentinula edodes]
MDLITTVSTGILAIWMLCLVSVWVLFRIYCTKLQTANIRRRTDLMRKLGRNPESQALVGFFHPYCNAGGGGERVLWTAIAAIQRTEPNIVTIVYSGDTDATKDEIISKVKARFDITLDPEALDFVFLSSRRAIEDSTWRYFTLLGQSLGSMYLAWEAMSKLIPDLYIDTMGYAFTFHIVSLLTGIPVGAYVHYPTISTSMLNRVKSRKKWHTNSDVISSSTFLSQSKLLYYRVFMYYYALSLKSAAFIMVNSSWTQNHINEILQYSDVLLDTLHRIIPFKLIHSKYGSVTSAQIVYPPCDTREISQFPLTGRDRVILSLAQFRPEKDHPTQLRAFSRLLKDRPEYINPTRPVKLVLIGGSRNADDEARVQNLRSLAKDLNLEAWLKNIEFVVNAPYPTVLNWLAEASIGLSTMVDEHFGINVVEFMVIIIPLHSLPSLLTNGTVQAAGLIPVAHKSGGPLQDIIVPFQGQPTGYHADSVEAFAEALHSALSLSTDEDLAMRQRARAWAVQRFSEEEFEKGWNASRWKSFISLN